jgi:aminoglycoside 3-N-acetyltransferase
VEKQLAVPYRYDKPFSGHYINEQGITSEKTFIHFVSDLEKPQDRAEFTLFDRQARRAGLVKSTNLGKGQLVSISATDTFFLIEQALKQAPRFLTARQTTVYT